MTNTNIMDNQQGYNLTNNQVQVLISGILGDGHIAKGGENTAYYSTNCKYKEYLIYKSLLLGDLTTGEIRSNLNQGYKQELIYSLISKYNKDIYTIKNSSLEDNIKLIDELGLALWVYDDGSLHKTNHFYNINTHSFTREEQEDVLIPRLLEFGITAKCISETKKDGRKFWYLYVSRSKGAFEISQLLYKYYVPCYNYKIWPSETIQKWSKVQAYLKSQGRELTPRLIGDYMKKPL